MNPEMYLHTYDMHRLAQSSGARHAHLQSMHRLMSGFGSHVKQRSKSLIINGINYGLMLEVTRHDLHKRIDERFDEQYVILLWDREMPAQINLITSAFRGAIEAMQRVGRGLPTPVGHYSDAIRYINGGHEIKKEVSPPAHYFGIDIGDPAGARSVISFVDQLGLKYDRERSGYYDKWYTKLCDWLRYYFTPWT